MVNKTATINRPRRSATLATNEPQRVNAWHYTIQSDGSSAVYDLTIGDHNEWQCTCGQYAFHYDCKHVRRLLGNFAETAAERRDRTNRANSRARMTLEEAFDYSSYAR